MKITLTLCALAICGAMSLKAADEKPKSNPQQETFKKLDANGDGKVTKAEFMAFPESQSDAAKAEQMWQHVSNGKEEITLAEFLALVSGGERKDKQLKSPTDAKQGAPATASATTVTDPEAMRKRLTEKVERVMAGAHKWAESGRDPSAIGQAIQEKFQPLMEAGKVKEAEAELDRLLELLKQEQK